MSIKLLSPLPPSFLFVYNHLLLTCLPWNPSFFKMSFIISPAFQIIFPHHTNIHPASSYGYPLINCFHQVGIKLVSFRFASCSVRFFTSFLEFSITLFVLVLSPCSHPRNLYTSLCSGSRAQGGVQVSWLWTGRQSSFQL